MRRLILMSGASTLRERITDQLGLFQWRRKRCASYGLLVLTDNFLDKTVKLVYNPYSNHYQFEYILYVVYDQSESWTETIPIANQSQEIAHCENSIRSTLWEKRYLGHKFHCTSVTLIILKVVVSKSWIMMVIDALKMAEINSRFRYGLCDVSMKCHL